MGSCCSKYGARQSSSMTTRKIIKDHNDDVHHTHAVQANQGFQADDVNQSAINADAQQSHVRPVASDTVTPSGDDSGRDDSTSHNSSESDEGQQSDTRDSEEEQEEEEPNDNDHDKSSTTSESDEDDGEAPVKSNMEAYASSDERFEFACQGRFDFEMPQNVKIVRIFTSSTFTGMGIVIGSQISRLILCIFYITNYIILCITLDSLLIIVIISKTPHRFPFQSCSLSFKHSVMF